MIVWYEANAAIEERFDFSSCVILSGVRYGMLI